MSAPQQQVLNGRYRLLAPAGAGGMASVYQAQDLLLGRLVAVKLLHPSLTGDPQFLQRFQKEGHAAANLAHPNIVTVHDIGQDGRNYYIVMEFVRGLTLKSLLWAARDRSGAAIPLEQSLELAVQICDGVGYAHRAGLVHCDLKPQNVLITSDRRVKVADFGIARALSAAGGQEDGQVWGTPQYFSPEQAQGRPATPASDVYSIGVILFEMLTGRLPFAAEEPAELAVMHVSAEPPYIRVLRPELPVEIERILSKVLAKEPSGRYRTADQFGRVLRAFQGQKGGEVTLFPSPLPAARQRPTSELVTQASWIQAAAPVPRLAQPPAVSQVDPIRIRPNERALGPLAGQSGTTDWTAVLLGILALVSLLGLIPLWYLVYLRYVG